MKLEDFKVFELKDLIRKYKPKRILVESKNVLRDLVDYYKVKVPADKTMRPTTKYFKIEAPEYKGNAVLRAQK